ncbi:hypothetical protein BKA82DRAFT_4020198 [Pisolithus tinctorius]|nr:hypothetical protein BKA82DRAFT_4020198 [Pisolithus tinctorius]
MGKSQIARAAAATLVTHVTWKKVKTTRGSKEKMVKFTLRKKARYATSQSNESPTRAGSSSIQEPNLVQGNGADLYCYMDDASPLRTSRIPKSQNNYLEEWLPYKSRYLSVLLDMEAPPDVMACFQHKLRPFHRVQKWNGRFFEDFTLQLVSSGCPAGEGSWEDAASHVDDEWEDIKESQQLAHLNPPDDRNYLTAVDTGSVHFCNVQYCNCPGSEDSHLQLTMAGLFLAMTKAPRTAFTFQVLEDFIRDNVECGTSTMNYYSKLQRVTSSVFPHLVPPDLCSWRSARTFVMDGNFKAKHMLPKNAAEEVWLMDGSGFMKLVHHDLSKGTGLIALCRNLTAITTGLLIKQMHKGISWNQLGLVDVPVRGTAVLYLMQWSTFRRESSTHQFIVPGHDLQYSRQVNMDYALVHATHHGLDPWQPVITFYDINCASWVDGEIMETLWSSLNITSPSAWGMATAHRQESLDFQMNDTSALKWKFKVAKQSLATIQDKFNELDSKVPDGLHRLWVEQELEAQSCQQNMLQAMDMYEVWLETAPTMKAIEIDLIHNDHSFSSSCGSATWIAQALKVEQAQIVLAMDTRQMDARATEADRLSILCQQGQVQPQIDALVHGAAQFIGNDWQVNPRQRPRSIAPFNGDSTHKTDDPFLPDHPGHQEYFHDMGLGSLVEQEIHLRQGQANDALRELCLERRELQNDNPGMGLDIQMQRQWFSGMPPSITSAESNLLHWGLGRTFLANPNARGHCNDTLAWFRTVDLPQDSAMNDRMLEFYPVNWLCTKALWDRWEEELELLTLETRWTQKFFLHKEKFWSGRHMEALAVGNTGFTCYSTRQSQMYRDLARTLGCTSR